MTDKTSRVVLKYEVDPASLARVEKSSFALEHRLTEMTKASRETAQAARQTGLAIREAFKDPGDKPIKRLLEERKALAETTAAQKKLADQRQKGSGGGLINTVGQGSTALSGLASVVGGSSALGGSLGGVGDILGAVEGVAKLKGELGALSSGLAQAGGLSGKFAGAVGGLGAAMGPAAVAVAAVSAAAAIYIDSVKGQSDALASYVRVQKEYYDLLRDGTTAEAKAKLKAAQDDLKSLEEQRAALKQKLDQEFKQEVEKPFGLGQTGAQIRTAARDLLDTSYKEAKAALADLDKKILDNKTSIDLLSGGLKANSFAANDAAAAEQRLVDARLKGIEKDIQNQIERERLIRDGSVKDVKDRLNNIKLERDATAAQIPVLEKLLEISETLGQSKAADTYRKQLEEYIKRLQSLDRQQIDLTNSILPLIEARNREKQAIDGTKEYIEQMIADLGRLRRRSEGDDDTIGVRGKENTEVEKLANEQITNENEKNQALIDITERYTADIKQIEADSARERAELNQRYADQLVDIARETADAAADNLRQLQQSREDIARDFGRDEQKAEREAAQQALDIRLDAAREEERDTREHLRRLEQIRRDAQDQELEFLLDRNFLGLFNLRRQTARQLEDESGGFAGQQSDRRAAAQQQVADLQRQIADERNERRIEYQQRLEDARIAFDRENVQIEANRQQQLARAQQQYQQDIIAQQQKTAQELAVRRGAAAEELRLVNLTERQKQAAYESSLAHARKVAAQITAIQDAAVQRSAAALNQITSSQAISLVKQGLTRRAGGGALAAGQSALVNDAYPGQRESFGGVPFPAGMGIFTPLTSGSVNPGSRAANLTIASGAIQVSGVSDPMQAANMVEAKVVAVLRRVMG